VLRTRGDQSLIATSSSYSEEAWVDLDEVADELYEVAPEEFIALRTARQDEARDDGDKVLAKQIGALPKPSTAAWVCNLLVRAHRAEIEGLVELGTLLRDAQEKLAGDELKALNRQRGQLLTALTRQASTLARERGHAVSTAMAGQVEETLRAAMADPEAGEALLTGRLTSPMSYSGLGTVTGRPDLRLVPPPTIERRPAEPPKRPPAKKAAPVERESAADRRAREREEQRRAAVERHRRELARAQEAAEEAAAAADEARTVADEQRRETEELAVEHADLKARVEELADQLAAAERDAGEAAAALKRAQRRSAAAEREAVEAAEARDRATAHVEHLQARGPE
jgi:DNA repair exonuclease SbcCD ATPase subunit